MSNSFKAFVSGARDASPILIGIVPFGLICGAIGVGTGMPEWASIGFSAIIFAGASQLVVNQLMAEHASLLVIILTGLLINMRMLMYSASLAPHFRGLPLVRKGLFAYLLTDQAYALSIARYGREDGESVNKPPYYLGTALTVWACFNGTTVLGAYLGAFIPPEWDLGFAIPLTFIAVVVPAIKDRPSVLAAMAAGIVALLAVPLPCNLGLMAGAVSGIAVGYLAERRLTRG
ncbi:MULTISPECIES: AzlC family ABC transporter permease [unclassified Pseudodesulfovibrio]|uniref:AzlC family ABC transporter permease n=1 Tax=unclassified Pseudodesulfovibrio TaxID=2661612 RepID=UPI000FEBC968|nr:MULTISPECIES: AzlC family ABC transporter permease [unclassified Pseudodesulfovibrio]MCJ2165663.1 AzlC family ABC transporter permease [Pseudodesulfovibrio sp. S3-i]RWU02929.1 branched-chain amino acid ABC transporter permease [Pseudodesulfovibrio sp. S3]